MPQNVIIFQLKQHDNIKNKGKFKFLYFYKNKKKCSAENMHVFLKSKVRYIINNNQKHKTGVKIGDKVVCYHLCVWGANKFFFYLV